MDDQTPAADVVGRLKEGVWDVGLSDDGCTATFDIDGANDVMQDAATEIETLRAQLTAATRRAEKIEPYRSAIEEALITDCIFSEELAANPAKALEKLIEWNCEIALDPAVSRQAAELLNRHSEQVMSILAPFAEWADWFDSCEQHPNGCPDDAQAGEVAEITVGDLRRARDTLRAQSTAATRRAEQAERMLAEWVTWVCGQDGPSPFHETKNHLATIRGESE